MNPKDHTVPVRHHLTLICEDPRWDADTIAEYVGDLCRDSASDGLNILVSPFDENQELVELRRTVDEAFRVIGTGAIHLLQQGDGWEKFRALVATLKAFVEQGERYSSSCSAGTDPGYVQGEEDGYTSAIDALRKIIEMCEEQR